MSTSDTIRSALDVLAQALQIGDRKKISTAMNACRRVLQIEGTDEEISAIAMVYITTDAGQFPISLSSLKCASREDFMINIRWGIVLRSLKEKQVIAFRNHIQAEYDVPTESDSSMDSSLAVENSEVPHGEPNIILQPPYAGAESKEARPRGFCSNKEYILECFRFIDSLIDHVETHEKDIAPISPALEGKYKYVRYKARNTQPCPPLEVLCQALKLGRIEWTLIVLAIKAELNGKAMDTTTATELLRGDLFDQFEFRKHFASSSVLIRAGILQLEQSYKKAKADISIPEDLLEWLVSGGAPPQPIHRKLAQGDPFDTNHSYVEAWIELAEQVLQMGETASQRYKRTRHTTRNEPAINDPGIKDRLRELLGNGKEYPFRKLIDQHQLPPNHCIVLAIGLYATSMQYNIPVDFVLNLLSGDDTIERMKLNSLFSIDSLLIRNKLLHVGAQENGDAVFRMPDRLAFKLLGIEHDTRDSAYTSHLFELQSPKHDLSSVVLPPQLRMEIEAAIASTSPEMRKRLETWGISTVTATRPSGSLTMIYSGAPGTGKTFTARAVAGELNRELMIVDAERILSKWHGDTEHNLQRVFEAYTQMADSCHTAPLMLLNECDQLLGRRDLITDSNSSQTEYRMLNILLEHLEQFQGVLIATTNRIEALDEALSRRFDIKLIFPMPDAELRLVLWGTHSPSSVPLSSDVNLQHIASKYCFSGGQISICAAASIRNAVHRGDHVTMNDLVHACEAESNSNFEHHGFREHPIGFRR